MRVVYFLLQSERALLVDRFSNRFHFCSDDRFPRIPNQDRRITRKCTGVASRAKREFTVTGSKWVTLVVMCKKG